MNKPHMVFVAVLLFVAFLPRIVRSDPPKEVRPDLKNGTLEIHYHRFVLLKHQGKVIALH